MTVIAGLVVGNQAWIGADSMASSGDVCSTTATPKIGKFGNLLMGYAGSFRVGNQFFKVARNAHMPTMEQLLENVKPDDSDWELLFIENQRIYEVSSDLGVVEARKDHGISYGAIGTGTATALGALYIATSEQPDEGSLMRVLEATAEHCGSVRPPFSIIGNL
jgi:ATP-dependent protease HslVU (ClpYQ) peptidase subunit